MEHLESTVVTNSIVSMLIRLPATSNQSDIVLPGQLEMPKTII